MPRRHWIAVLSIWPGLPQVWPGQELLGLILAALFAATLNAAVISRYLLVRAFPPGGSTFLPPWRRLPGSPKRWFARSIGSS